MSALLGALARLVAGLVGTGSVGITRDPFLDPYDDGYEAVTLDSPVTSF